MFQVKIALCDKRLPLSHRIRLLNSVVGPRVVYGAGAWTVTVSCEQRLLRTQRKMLRWIVQTIRLPEENWVEYIKRATHVAEDVAATHGSKNWVQLQRRRQWMLAGKVASAEDDRWSNRILGWKPWFRSLSCRPVGHPCKRWDDHHSARRRRLGTVCA